MADISDKLTYLNETKGLIKKGLNDLGADLTDASSFRSYANVLSGMYDDYPKVTGEGVDLSLSPTKQGKLAIAPKGNSSQFSTTGKNLLPPNINTQTLNGLTITNNNDGTYILNGTASAQTNFVFDSQKWIDFKAGTYTVSCNTFTDITLAGYYGSGTNCFWKTSNGLFTLNDDISNFRFQITASSGATFDNVIIKPMIEPGSTATDFEPYTNGVAPNPDYPQDVKTVTGENSLETINKNLFIFPNTPSVTVNGITSIYSNNKLTYSGTATGAYTNATPTVPFKITAGTYTISLENALDVNFQIRFQKTTRYTDGGTNIGIIKGSEETTFTLTEDYYYAYLILVFTNGTTVSGSTSIQIEKGSTATEYVEHQEQNYPITLKSSNLFEIADGTYSSSGGSITFKNGVGKISIKSGITSSFGIQVSLKTPIVLKANKSYIRRNFTTERYPYVQLYDSSSHTIDGMTYDDNGVRIYTPTEDVAVYAIYLWCSVKEYPDIKPMMIEGTELDSFAPYSTANIELNSSPDGTIRDEIRGSSDVSYNLFDKDNAAYLDNANVSSSSVINIENNFALIYIKLKAGTYNISNDIGSYQWLISDCEDIPAIGVSTSPRQVVTETNTTYTLSSERYLLIRVAKSTISINDFIQKLQITEGSEAKPYFPYGQVGMWWKREYIGKIVLDGTNVVFTYQDQSTYPNCLMIPASSRPRGLSDLTSLRCTHFSDFKSGVGSVLNALYWGNTTQMWLCKDGFSSLEAGNAWLQSQYNNNSPVIVYYPLETPTDIPITDTTLISQLNDLYDNGRSYDGITNITSTYENGNEQMIIYAEALMDISDSTKVKINEENLTNIANTLRTRNRTTALYTPAQMPAAIETVGDMGDISNGIIEEYLTTSDTIDANTFVEFVNTNDYTLSTDTELSSSYYSYAYARAVKLNDTKVFIVHNSNTDTMGLNGMVCEINGDTITHGADTVLSAAYASSSFASPVAIDENTVFISHSAGGDNPGLNGIVCTISGLVITPGTDTVLVSTVNSYYSSYATPIFNTREGWVLVTHMSDEDNFYLNGIICHISGTTITHNTDTTIVSTMGSYTNAKAVELASGYVFIAHPNGTKLNGIMCTISTINGGSLYLYTDTAIVSTSGSWNNANLLRLDSARVLITHANNSDNAYLNAIVCSISYTTITPGTDTQLEAVVGASNGSYPVLLEEDKVFIAHGDSYFDGRLKAAICTISGTTITLVLNDVIDSDVSSINEVNPVVLDDTTVFILHCTGGDGHYMSLTLSGLIYKIAKKIKIAEDSIDGMTKEECSSTTAGDVWVLEPYVEVNPEDLM